MQPSEPQSKGWAVWFLEFPCCGSARQHSQIQPWLNMDDQTSMHWPSWCPPP